MGKTFFNARFGFFLHIIPCPFGWWWWWWWFDVWSVRQRLKSLKLKQTGELSVRTKCQNNCCSLSAYSPSVSLALAQRAYEHSMRMQQKQSNLFSCYYPICKSHLFVRIIYGYLYLILLIVFGLFLRTVCVFRERKKEVRVCIHILWLQKRMPACLPAAFQEERNYFSKSIGSNMINSHRQLVTSGLCTKSRSKSKSKRCNIHRSQK